MFFSRRLNPDTNKVEVWECEWSNKATGAARKNYLRRVGDEDQLDFSHDEYSVADAVCWAPGRTIGNIAVTSDNLLGMFDGKSGDDAELPCEIIPCGKFRHGAPRWYCKTHQIHWGTKPDFEAARKSGEVFCSNHLVKMSYVVNPLEISFSEYEEIGIWCSLPPAMSSLPIERRPPKIHVHKRFTGREKKAIDLDFNAVVCSYNQDLGLFQSTEITKIQIIPPAAFEFVSALESGRPTACVTCKKCGYPHLDLGDFAQTPHRKHFCGNCGNDSIWSREAIVSTPLKPLHDQFNNSNRYIEPDRSISLDDYPDHHFDIWSSTPAVVWTADRPQEKGIHVHIHDPGRRRVIDDTFASVIYKGQALDRGALWRKMVENTIL